MFTSGGTATTTTIGTVAGGTTLTPQVVSESAHDSAAGQRLSRSNVMAI